MTPATIVDDGGPAAFGLLAAHPDVSTLGHWLPLLTTSTSAGPMVAWGDVGGFPAAVWSLRTVHDGVLVTGGRDEACPETSEPVTRTCTWSRGIALRDDSAVLYPAPPVVASFELGDVRYRAISATGSQEDAEALLAEQVAAADAFAQRFGELAWDEVDAVAVPLGRGAAGMEFPGLTLVDDEQWANLEGAFGTAVIAHEVGHQWFHALVGNGSLSDPVVDESLAQYLTYLYWRDTFGEGAARRYAEQAFARALPAGTRGRPRRRAAGATAGGVRRGRRLRSAHLRPGGAGVGGGRGGGGRPGGRGVPRRGRQPPRPGGGDGPGARRRGDGVRPGAGRGHPALLVRRGADRLTRSGPPTRGASGRVAGRGYARAMPPFKVVSEFEPAGDQPQAIDEIVAAFEAGEKAVTLLGATGTGKTFTATKVLERLQRPALVIAPNKTLAAQLANEFRDFLPDNAVEYFVSYYDYYQPEAYVPSSDTYIEKDSSVNDEIEKLRHRSTQSLIGRRDVVVVASVSCIYGLGSPERYREHTLFFRVGEEVGLDRAMRMLVDQQYTRNDLNLVRGTFRVRGDTLEVHPAYDDRALRIEFFGDEVERIVRVDTLTGETSVPLQEVAVLSASHYVTDKKTLERALGTIEAELTDRLADLEKQGKLLEAQRLRMRTSYDLEMIREVGFCNGIENYSRHLDGRSPGEPPYTLLDYFPDDYVVFIDESHVTVPQIGGMYEGDRSRKETLVEHGFRLPSAMDNRPLTFDEFLQRVGQRLFVSATPGPYERRESDTIAEQIIRPTGLVDPEVVVRPTRGQIDDLMHEIRERAKQDERVLVTTLTKKMAEDLTDYLLENGVRVRYLHSDINTVERVEILRSLRMGEFDVVVGINLLREGLDLPEVSLVAILDADKEGFLRSSTSLIQTIGRAARNVNGQVLMYADNVTDSMRTALDETDRRREKQLAYNAEHGIDPQTIRKRVGDIIAAVRAEEAGEEYVPQHRQRRDLELDVDAMPQDELAALIQSLEQEMHAAAGELRFEYAARLRDELADLKRELKAMKTANV